MGTFACLYINGAALRQFLDLVFREIMRTEYGAEIDELQLFMTFVFIPWDFKILFGIITDTVKLPLGASFNKAPRRGYIMLLAFIQAVCLLVAAFYKFEYKIYFFWLFFTVAFCSCFMDVVIDGICCIM